MNSPKYELEERTYEFALKVRLLLANEKISRVCWSDVDQIVRSSGSVGANYIEANDALSPADKIYRMKVARKEAKESRYWARLLSSTLPAHLRQPMAALRDEADELMRILGAIIKKLDPKWSADS